MKYFVLFLLGTSIVFGQERYSRVHIPLSQSVTAEDIQRLGFALEEGTTQTDGGLELWASGREVERLRQRGIPFRILIEDWNAHYAEQLRADRGQSPHSQPSITSVHVQHFHPGSMGGFLTFQEVLEELDAMRVLAPGLLSANDTIGTTTEGRPIIAVRLTASRAVAPPAVFYNGLTHAREPMGMMNLVYFLWYCIEQYGTNTEVTKLLDHAALHFVLVVNPDGYEYNRMIEPKGGGMWRKNRMRIGIDTLGVDLNRNFGHLWAYDDQGSSSDSTVEVYRGAAPFSERETDALRRYCNRYRFRAAMNYHSTSNLLICPMGHIDAEPPDSVAYRIAAQRITSVNRYTWGNSLQTVGYKVNGDAVSWMYGDSTNRPSILAFTPEVGTHADGFWPKPSSIPILAAMNLEANLQLAHEALPFVQVSAASVTEDAGGMTLALLFDGHTAGSRIDTVRVTTSSTALEAVTITRIGVPFPSSTPLHMQLAKKRTGASDPGRVRIDIETITAESVMRDSVVAYLGYSAMLLADGAETANDVWEYGGAWGRQTCEAARGGFCYTESPDSNYEDNTSSAMTLRRPLDLRSYTAATLHFVTRWHIQTFNDFGVVEASGDGGSAWSPLAGRFTSFAGGDGKQVPIGNPVYDGKRNFWADEEMDLTPFCGKENVLVRFRFESDGGGYYDGWLVDSIAIAGHRPPVTRVEDRAEPGFSLSEAAPNPCTDAASLAYTLPRESSVSFTITDALGRVLASPTWSARQAGTHRETFLSGFPAGIYFLRMEAGIKSSGTRAFIATRRIAKLD